MGAQVHVLSEIDHRRKTAVCRGCGPVRIINKGKRYGRVYWVCAVAHEARRKKANAKYEAEGRRPLKKRYRLLLKDRCERCGFVPEHICQLDGHHRNGDHSDNRPKNIETLCANCHRLEHFTP